MNLYQCSWVCYIHADYVVAVDAVALAELIGIGLGSRSVENRRSRKFLDFEIEHAVIGVRV